MIFRDVGLRICGSLLIGVGERTFFGIQINLYACMLHAHGFLSFYVGTFCIFDILPVVILVHIEVLMICECVKK